LSRTRVFHDAVSLDHGGAQNVLVGCERGVKLLELAQVPKENVGEFKSIGKFKIFNTNNLWVRLDALEKKLAKNELNMDIIPNVKKVGEQPVLQLEQAAGAAIGCFAKSIGINVPRRRFLPVKGTADLLMLQSNLYTLGTDGSLTMSPARPYTTSPIITLGPCMQKVGEYNDHIGSSVNILELDRLTVFGNVKVGRNVTLKGTVIIVAPSDEIVIPDNTELENKIVTATGVFKDIV